MQFLKKNYGILIVLILSFWAIKPFFAMGFFPMHDDTQVARVFEMGKVLKGGIFPVRWVPDLGYGYGYPIFNFYAPLAYYVGGLFMLLGFDALMATKIMMALGIVLAGVFMYLLSREFFGEYGGVLSGLFYIYDPYHAVNIYVRGDVAEFWAYAFLPLMFLGFYKVFRKSNVLGIFGSLGFAGIILSHNLSAFMITPFLLIFCLLLIYYSEKRARLHTTLSLLFYAFLGLTISGFYWIPVFLEMKYTNVLSQVGGGADFKDHFVCLGQLWTGTWGYGGSTIGCNDGLSFMVGKYHIVLSAFLFLLAIFILFSRKYLNLFAKDKFKLIAIVISFVAFLISIFLTLEISKPIWELFSPMAFIQYPWRYLLLSAFFSSFISGAIIWVFGKFILNRTLNFILVATLCVWIVFVSAKFFVPQMYLPNTSADYTNNYTLQWTTSLISDEYLPKNFKKPKNAGQIANFSNLNSKNLKIMEFTRKTQELNLDLLVYKNTNLVLPLAYFPAWKGTLDGNAIALIQDPQGILVALPKGNHSLKLTFASTVPEIVGNILSVAGILVLFIGIIQSRKKNE